jgi:hypothetical protein
VLTTRKLSLLRYVAEYRSPTLYHLATLAELSPKTTRREMRELFDHCLVDVVPVPRAAVGEPTRANGPELLYGSAPNVYTLTRVGLKVLQTTDETEPVRLPAERYGPRNTLFLMHELALRDVRVHFELSARRHEGHRLQAWYDGPAAEIDLKRTQPPKVLRPDAWLVYGVTAGLKESVLVSFVELDRGTERGARRWKEKVAAYEALFQSGRLQDTTGYTRARVLVVVPDARRRDHLAALITDHAAPALRDRFWLAERSILSTPDIFQMGWRQAGSQLIQPLLRPQAGPPHGEADRARR